MTLLRIRSHLSHIDARQPYCGVFHGFTRALSNLHFSSNAGCLQTFEIEQTTSTIDAGIIQYTWSGWIQG